MILPKKIDFLNRNLLCLWQEEEYEGAHDENQASKDQEYSIFEMAKWHKETLSYQSCEEQVNTDHHALPSWPCLQREELTRNQPPERTPRPAIGEHEQADDDHKEGSNAFGECVPFSKLKGQGYGQSNLIEFMNI